MLAALSRVTILLAAWMRRRHEEVASLNMCVFSDVVVVSTVSCRCLWCCIVARWKKGQGFLASGLEKNEGGSCYFIFWLPKTKTNFCVHQSLANTPNPSKQQNPIDVCSNELLVDLEYFSTFLCCCVVHGYILSLWVISKWWFLDCSSNIKSVHKWIKYQIFPPLYIKPKCARLNYISQKSLVYFKVLLHCGNFKCVFRELIIWETKLTCLLAALKVNTFYLHQSQCSAHSLPVTSSSQPHNISFGYTFSMVDGDVTVVAVVLQGLGGGDCGVRMPS